MNGQQAEERSFVMREVSKEVKETALTRERAWQVVGECPNCGHKENSPDAKFCNQCGKVVVGDKCSRCGRKNRVNANFCNQCGATFLTEEEMAEKKK